VRSRLVFFLLLVFVILCIVLDGLQQVWVEWKRLLWCQLGMAVREKLSLRLRRPLSRAPR
jgi:hypothetical protein